MFLTKEMHSVALIIFHDKNWSQRSKRFIQLLKSKIQLLTAHADRLTYLPKLVQFPVGVHYTLRFARKMARPAFLCTYTHICTKRVRYEF